MTVRDSARPDIRLMEVVLKTAQFETIIDWYSSFLQRGPFLVREPESPGATVGGQERASDMRLAFFMIHDEVPYMQLFGVFALPAGVEGDRAGPGMHHMQFRVESLEALARHYERLRDLEVTPHRTSNHGFATSMYYRDPDRNIVEVSCANFGTVEEQAAFLASDGFRANPSGVELEAAEFVGRYRSGVDRRELLALPG